MTDDGWAWLARECDDDPPSVPEATVRLVDALRDYIRAEDAVGDDLLFEGSITRAQYDEWLNGDYRKRLADILKEFEGYGFDPSLQGLIPWKGVP
jgi:hypothetical protein